MSWRDHPMCASEVAWPDRFWGPERLDPGAWLELVARLDPAIEVATLIQALAMARRGAGPRRLLDVGGGTGFVTRALAARFGGCVVVEPSAAQVAGLPAGLVVARGRAEALPIADGAVDAAVATWVLQYTDDPRAAVAELARVVAPGGMIAIVQAAPGNELVRVYNDEARIAGLGPAHHGWLFATAADVLAQAGFGVALAHLPISMRASPAEAETIAAILARLHFAGHPRIDEMIAATAPRIAQAARGNGALRDDGVLLIATRR